MNRIFPVLIAIVFCLVACRKGEDLNDKTAKIVLQTDWFAQPEHGGFYQALAKGYYEDEGLSVEILQGGPNAMTTQKVIKGKAQFAIHRADSVYKMVERGIDVKFIMPTLQHDPQGLMFHSTHPLFSFKELENRKTIGIPGLSWIKWIESRYDISLAIEPHDFGMERFLSNPELVQQCLITNEPYYAALNGAKVEVLLLSLSGFDPYHGIYALNETLTNNPETVKAFVRASLRGWADFIQNDPQPAFRLIAKLNPKMSQAFMDFSYQKLKSGDFVTGDNSFGILDEIRLNNLVEQMKAYGMVDSKKKIDWYTTEFLPLKN